MAFKSNMEKLYNIKPEAIGKTAIVEINNNLYKETYNRKGDRVLKRELVK